MCAITRRANCVPIFSPLSPKAAYFRYSTSANLSILARGTPSFISTSSLAASPLCEWSVEVLERGVLSRADQERLDRHRPAGDAIDVGLSEAGRVGRRAWLFAVRIEAVDAGKRAVFVVERAVLVEDDEDVFDLFAQRRDVVGRPVRPRPARIAVGDKKRRDIRLRIGLRRHQRPGIGGERRLSEGGDGDQRRRAAKDEFHRKAQRSRCLCRRGLQADAVTVERGGLVYRWRSGAKFSLGALSVWSADGRRRAGANVCDGPSREGMRKLGSFPNGLANGSNRPVCCRSCRSYLALMGNRSTSDCLPRLKSPALPPRLRSANRRR